LIPEEFNPMRSNSNIRRISLLLSGILLLPLWGCGDGNNPPPRSQDVDRPAIVQADDTAAEQKQNLQDGQYPIQQASYDDGAGDYTVMLLNTPKGMDSTVTLGDVKMARLTDEQIKAGEKSYVKIEAGQPTMYLTEDFKIEHVHNVTEVQTNPQTGTRETVIVRRESSFWTPFLGSVAGNIAGQAIGSMLFRPQYYIPPVYQPGMGMSGFGGYGNSYGQAVDNYRSRYNQPPIVERNRTNFRTTGQIRNPSNGFKSPSITRAPRPQGQEAQRSTGSGFGSSNLKRTGKTYNSPSIGSPSRSSGGFGSGSRSRSSGGFGSSRGGGRRR
jgi:hypothetical protein